MRPQGLSGIESRSRRGRGKFCYPLQSRTGGEVSVIHIPIQNIVVIVYSDVTWVDFTYIQQHLSKQAINMPREAGIGTDL